MNPYLINLNRIEFVVTLACTGRCKHCSEGEHFSDGEYIDGDIAAEAVRKICAQYHITSLMTFGGEPLLRPEAVCKIHAAAVEMNIPKRQIITNGFFSKSPAKINAVAADLAKSGVNNVLLSVDAFHQETIPLETVKLFALAAISEGIPVSINPAWLVSREADNSYNTRTHQILEEIGRLNIPISDGNIIFPSGNALVYLKEYFSSNAPKSNPYDENPKDLHSVCFSQNGDVLDGNVYNTDISEILERYAPQ